MENAKSSKEHASVCNEAQKEKTEIRIYLCFDVENQIIFDDPGLVKSVFEDLFDPIEGEAPPVFSEYCKQVLMVDPEKRCSFLVEEFSNAAGFGEDRDFFYDISKLTVLSENGLWYIDNLDITVSRVRELLGTEDIAFGILINGNAGEYFRGRYPGYTFDMHCREDMRHIPHIHVMYHHENDSVFKIKDGEMKIGTLSKKHQRKVAKIIFDNKEFLMKEWDRMHEGLRCDLDCGLGNKNYSFNQLSK